VIYVDIKEAVAKIESGNRVFVHGSAATPIALLKALFRRKHELKDVELISLSTYGEIDMSPESLGDSFYINSLFVSKNVRRAVNSDCGEYIPIFLSEIHTLFDQGLLPIDVALIHVSPPDKHGYCTLGTSVDIAQAALRSAKSIIAQINPHMPRTHGAGSVHTNDINFAVQVNEDLPLIEYASKSDEKALKIGAHCAELIEDGATLQLGIGAIPDAVLASLTNHKDLGIHTEMFSDGIIPLVNKGVITNKYKKIHPEMIVTSFVAGTKLLYDFVDDNPQVMFLEASFVNDTSIIRKNPKMVSINSAIEIDITGQVCADSIGTYQYSGVGGQMDFIRGASLSQGGKPILALKSSTKEGYSKIVPFLKQGAGIVTTRAHVHWVVTEYGSAYLFGKNLHQRAKALCNIAHPEHRENLEKEIHNRFGR
jgi:acyl-CoA hydrolase